MVGTLEDIGRGYLHATEALLSALTRRRLKRGGVHSIADLQAAVRLYIAEHPEPFAWFKRRGRPSPSRRRSSASSGHGRVDDDEAVARGAIWRSLQL
jgi:hypothetical protein